MRKRLTVLGTLAVLLWLWGCAAEATPAATPAPTVTPRPAWTLTPYAPGTPTPTAAPPTAPPLPTAAAPSPTPWVYEVKEGDTMLGIALRFGVALDALEQANPGVSPEAMAVGTKLIIPVNVDNPAGLPTPTPVPLEVGEPFCAPAADGGAVCLTTVSNPGTQAVEAVSVWLALQNGAAQEVEALQDLLPVGERAVVVARFAAPAPPVPRAAARLLRALPVDEERLQQRYVKVTLSQVSTQVAEDGLHARVSGEVAPEGAAAQLWVVAVAYDAAGHPVGARRWEASAEALARPPVAFSFAVYSVGPPIVRVVVTAEAHTPPR